VICFIDEVRERFGVEPVCRVRSEHGVRIAPRTYYAAKVRAPSVRAVRDAAVLAQIERIHSDPPIGRGLYGVRKVLWQLRREGGVDGRPVSRRQVERLMRAAGLQGARRGRKHITTKPDPSVQRAPDLVSRDFTATAPNRLWLVDFTYVPTWSGWRSPRSSPTPTPGGSRAGAPPPRCPRPYRSTPWRWRYGPAKPQATRSTAGWTG
jgi:putative transposase